MKALQQKSAPSAAKSATKKGTRANGSDFSSARGSEERHVSTAAQSGRGPRRNRDYDLENVSPAWFSFCWIFSFPVGGQILRARLPQRIRTFGCVPPHLGLSVPSLSISQPLEGSCMLHANLRRSLHRIIFLLHPTFKSLPMVV